MHQRSKRYETLRRLAQGREDQALAGLAREQQSLEAAESRLAELQAYLADYERSAPSGSVTIAAVTNRMRFVERLREAVRVQGHTVSRAHRALDESRNHWVDEWRSRRSFDLLHSRLAEQESCTQRRSEQRELDEAGQRGRPQGLSE